MVMKAIWITATCGKGHSQRIRFEGDFFTLQYVRSLAALLDGSSEMYLHPPGLESTIGKCGICGSQIACSVEVDDERAGPR